jgi:hypothetical protein
MTDENTEAPKPAKRRGRPKGCPRHPNSGRRRGTPNRVNSSIHDLLKAMGCDPRMVLVRICMNAKNSADLRRKAAADLMGYAWPKLNSVDTHVTGEMQQTTVLQVVTGIARVPTSPPLSPEEVAQWRSAIDVTPTAEALSAPNGPLAEDPSISEPGPAVMPAGHTWHPAPVETVPPAPPSISSGRFDSKSDEVIDRARTDDAKIATLNSRAAKFVA